MSSATITTLVGQLAVITPDATAVNNFQDDIILEMARGTGGVHPPQIGTAFIAGVAGTERYTLPDTVQARLAIAILYDQTQLLTLRKEEAWAYEEAWRETISDQPIGVVYDPEDRTNFSVVPPPRLNGDAIGVANPVAFTTFPGNNITAIFTRTDLAFPGTTYSDYILPVALETLAREFARDSDHQDATFAALCHGLAKLFFTMTRPKGRPT